MEPYTYSDQYFKDFKTNRGFIGNLNEKLTSVSQKIPEPVKKYAPKVAKGAGQTGGAFTTGYMLGELADLGMEKATGYGMQDRYTDIASNLLGQQQQYGEGASAVTAFDAIQQGVDPDTAMDRFPVSKDPNFDLIGASQRLLPGNETPVPRDDSFVSTLARGLQAYKEAPKSRIQEVLNYPQNLAVDTIGKGAELAGDALKGASNLAGETAVYLFDKDQPTFAEIRAAKNAQFNPEKDTIRFSTTAPGTTAPGTTAPTVDQVSAPNTTPTANESSVAPTTSQIAQSLFPAGYDETGTKIDETGAPVSVPVTDQDRQDMQMPAQRDLSPIERFSKILQDLPPDVSQENRLEIAAQLFQNFMKVDRASEEAPVIGIEAAARKYGVSPTNIINNPYGVKHEGIEDAPRSIPGSSTCTSCVGESS